MKYIFIVISIFVLAYSNSQNKKDNTSFLTQYEYGKELYNNPRNIGCIKCHGEYGEGKVISYIKQDGKNKPIIAPRITNISFIKLENALKNPKGFMPKYDLIASEMLALYVFLNNTE